MAFKSKNDNEYDVELLSSDAVSDILSGAAVPDKVKKTGNVKMNWKYIGITAAVIAVIAGIIVGGGLYFEKKHQDELAEAEKKQPKDGMTYFQAEEEEPEKSKTELTATIAQAFYTNDGSLAVYFCFANGMEKDQRLNSVEVKIENGNDEQIASGYSDAIEDDFIIKTDSTKNLLLYISPEYVKIADDPLTTIAYDITTNYEPVE